MPKVPIPDEFLDDYTLKKMRKPVMANDGYTYDRAFIEAWFKTHDISPKTDRPILNKVLKPNESLEKEIENFKKKNNICTEEQFFAEINSGRLSRVNKLYYTNIHLHAKNKDGWTPLHVAINLENVEIARFLLGEGAPVDATDDRKQTPLHFAVLQSDKQTEFEMVRLLLAFRAKFNVRDESGMTPLHVAVQNKHLKALKLLLIENEQALEQILLEHKNVLESKNNDGETPLHIAARYCDGKEAARLLLQYGADLNIKNNKELTPIKLARQKENFAIAKLIEDYQNKLAEKAEISKLRAENLILQKTIENLLKENATLKPEKNAVSSNPYMMEIYKSSQNSDPSQVESGKGPQP